MAITFEGRFHAPYSANLSDYNRVEWQDDNNEDTVVGASADIPGNDAGRSGHYEYSNDPVGVEDRVVRLYTDLSRPGRTELRPMLRMFGNTGGPVYGENWIATWQYIPRGGYDLYEPSGGFTKNVPAVAGTNQIIWQIPAWPDAHDILDEPGAPVNGHHSTFILAIVNRNIEFRRTSDANTPTTERAPNQVIIRKFCPLEWVFDRWVEWVFHIKHAVDGTGFIHIYRDRYLELSIENINSAYNDTLGPYVKTGLYKYFNATYSPTALSLYSKGVVIGDDSSDYEEVTGHASLGYSAGRGIR